MLRIAPTLIGLFFTGNCLADWQYARFGMTVDEVVAASKGAATAIDSPNHDMTQGDQLISKARAKAEYAFGGFTFDVYFGFDPREKTLRNVRLNLKDGTRPCEPLIDEVRNTYGKPDFVERNTFFTQLTWRSHSSGNLVELTRIGDRSCSIRYEPLPSPGKGL